MASGTIKTKTAIHASIGDTNRQATGSVGNRGGTYDHSQLINRDKENQHTISAISGLSAVLDGKLDALTALPLIEDATKNKAAGLYFDAKKELANKPYWYLTSSIDPATGVGIKDSIISGPYDLGSYNPGMSSGNEIQDLSGYVEKVEGMGLSQENFTSELLEKLNNSATLENGKIKAEQIPFGTTSGTVFEGSAGKELKDSINNIIDGTTVVKKAENASEAAHSSTTDVAIKASLADQANNSSNLGGQAPAYYLNYNNLSNKPLSDDEVQLIKNEYTKTQDDNPIVHRIDVTNLESKVVPRRMSIFSELTENAENGKCYLYVDNDGTDSKISLKKLISKTIRTASEIPTDLQAGEYVFLEKKGE